MWQCPYLNHYYFFSQNHICPIVHVYNPNSKSESQSQYLLYLIHFSIWQSENMEILSSNSEHKNMLNRYMHVVFYIEFQLLWQRGTYLYICSYVASWSRICSWGLIWQSLFIVLNNCIPCKLVQDHSRLNTQLSVVFVILNIFNKTILFLADILFVLNLKSIRLHEDGLFENSWRYKSSFSI